MGKTNGSIHLDSSCYFLALAVEEPNPRSPRIFFSVDCHRGFLQFAFRIPVELQNDCHDARITSVLLLISVVHGGCQ